MKFNETFDDFMSLYVEGYDPNHPAYNRTPEQQAEIDKKKAQFKKNYERFAKEEPYPKIGGGPSHASPAPRSENAEDGEGLKAALNVGGRLVKTAAKLGGKLAGKAAMGTADLVTGGGASKAANTLKSGAKYVKDTYKGTDSQQDDLDMAALKIMQANPTQHTLLTARELAKKELAAHEDAEDIPGDNVDEFHRALDELIHKYLGHSSDEVEDVEDSNPDLNSGYEDDYEEDAEGKVDKDRMKCNSPRRTSGGSKKFVVKACNDGKEKVVRFGDPNMKIKKSNPKRRKSFRARHKCDQKKDKLSAGYWACKSW